MFRIYSFSDYNKAVVEVEDLKNFRDRLEENGNSTSDVDKRIEEVTEGIGVFRRENKL